MMQKEEMEMDHFLIKNRIQLIPLQTLNPLNKQLQATTWGAVLTRSKANARFVTNYYPAKEEKNKVDVISTLDIIELAGEDRLPAGNLGGERKAGQHNAEREGVPVRRKDDEVIAGGENGGLQGGAGGGAGGGGNGGEEPNGGMIVLDKAMCFICQEDPYEFITYYMHEFRVCDWCIGCL